MNAIDYDGLFSNIWTVAQLILGVMLVVIVVSAVITDAKGLGNEPKNASKS